MTENVGIKETREAVVAALTIATEAVVVFKDGIQLSEDTQAIVRKWNDDVDFREKITAGIADINKVPGEVGDLSLAETAEIIGASIPMIVKLIEAIRG